MARRAFLRWTGPAALFLLHGPLWAAQQEPEATTLATSVDMAERMTVPVTIDGHGPFAFAVDTGAERTVVSRGLAERLSLPAGPRAQLHGMAGVDQVSTAVIARLGFAGRALDRVHAPVLPDAALGAVGLLGIDALAGMRVDMDFAAATMTLAPGGGPAPRDEPGTIVVTARRRDGQLILVDVKVDGRPVRAIIDSGSQWSIGNLALRRVLARLPDARITRTELVSVTGRTLMAELAPVGRLELTGVSLAGLTVAFADAHAFRKFGLGSRPALLIGADVLRAFKRVSLDFRTRKIRLLPDPGGHPHPPPPSAGPRQGPSR